MGFLSSLFGIKGSQPKTSTVVQAQKLPEEISPFVKEILGEAQDLYKAEIERGYDPYTGETIAPLTAEEETAFAGISGLAGTTTPFLEEALGTYRGGAEKFTPEVAEEYKSPYQRAVTDIEKREAQTAFEKDVMPKFEASAIAAGGLSGLGTRAGVEAAELQRGQSQLLADIEAKGQQRAFEDARKGFESQKARERQMAGDVGRIGPALFQAGLAEQGALQAVGEQKRGLGQSALDEAYFRFLEEGQFPQKTLADYSGMVYANPMAGLTTQTDTTTGTPFVPSTGQQMMGLGLAGLNVFGMGGGFNPGGFDAANIWKTSKEGGPVLGRAEGGQTKIWDETQTEWKETPSGLKEMMKGSDGRYYTQGGEDQRGLYYPEEVAEVEEEKVTIEESSEPTSKPPAAIMERSSEAKGPPRSLTPQFSTTSAITPYAPSLIQRVGPIGGNVKPDQNIEGSGGLSYKELVQRNLVPQTQPQIVQTTLGPRQLDFPGHISIPQPEGGGDSRNPDKSYGAERRKGLSKERGGTWTYPQYNVGVALADLERRGDAYPASDIYENTDFTGFGMRHGGGLSQLANGGPVVYRQQGQGVRPKYGRRTFLGRGRPTSASPFSAMNPSVMQRQAGAIQQATQGSTIPLNQLTNILARRQQRPTINKPTPSGSGFGLKGGVVQGGGQPGQFAGVSTLTQPRGQSPGRRIAQHGQQGAFTTAGSAVNAATVPGGGIDTTDIVNRTIQSLGKDFLSGRGKNFSETVTEARTRIGGEEGFSKTKMTESFTDYQTSLKKLQKRMNAKNKAKRAEFNEADKKASEEFFAAQEKAIKSGNNADIIAGAMDTANQRQIKQGGGTIAQWLTDIMNVGVKGIGARRKEQGKELRELAKAKYKESRTDRKTNRSEELAEINKESLQEAKNLVDKYGFTKELANMDRATKTAALAEIAAMTAFERGELTKVEMMAKLLDVQNKGKTGGGKPVNFTDKMKEIRHGVADMFNWTLGDDDEVRDGNGNVILKSDPSLQQYIDEVNKRQRLFLETAIAGGMTQTSQAIGVHKVIPPAGATTQASGQGTQANPMTITNMSQTNNLPSGTYFTYQGKTYKSK
jgi:hypothetical protein